VWRAAMDVALSPDFVDDDAGRERYRYQVFASVRGQIMSLRPDRSHPAVGAAAGVPVGCTLCGVVSSRPVHLSDAGVDLRRIVVGVDVVLRTLDEEVIGRVVRMDTLTLGVVDVSGRGRQIFSALNVVGIDFDPAAVGCVCCETQKHRGQRASACDECGHLIDTHTRNRESSR
jgi:hypothetical protein